MLTINNLLGDLLIHQTFFHQILEKSRFAKLSPRQWYIKNSPTNQQPPEFYLVLTASAHKNNYTCVATNNAGNTTHTVSKSITVCDEST